MIIAFLTLSPLEKVLKKKRMRTQKNLFQNNCTKTVENTKCMSESLGACEFTACVTSKLSLPSMHRHRPAHWVVTLLASELKTANDKSWNNRKIIQI